MFLGFPANHKCSHPPRNTKLSNQTGKQIKLVILTKFKITMPTIVIIHLDIKPN